MSAKQEALDALSRANQEAAVGNKQQAQQQKMKQQQAQKEEMQTQIREVLRNCLEPDAMSRLDNIKLVKPEKYQGVSQLILQMIQSKQVAGKITDKYLKTLLGQISQSQGKSTASKKIIYKRRGVDSDSDDENYWSD